MKKLSLCALLLVASAAVIFIAKVANNRSLGRISANALASATVAAAIPNDRHLDSKMDFKSDITTDGATSVSTAKAGAAVAAEAHSIPEPVSIEGYKSSLRGLTDAELKTHVKKADRLIARLRLVDRANTVGLGASDAAMLADLVNRKAAAQVLIIERTLAALESRPTWHR